MSFSDRQQREMLQIIFNVQDYWIYIAQVDSVIPCT